MSKDEELAKLRRKLLTKDEEVWTGHLNSTSSDHLGSLLVEGYLSDVVLLKGNRKFPVHRAILAARSPVFRAMFTSNMKDSCRRIPIEDLEPDVLTRAASSNDVKTEKLGKAAEKN